MYGQLLSTSHEVLIFDCFNKGIKNVAQYDVTKLDSTQCSDCQPDSKYSSVSVTSQQ